jgi:hypothetical protein
VVGAGCEVAVPVYVGETHAGGLGRELFAEAGGVASWEEGEGFEDYAIFGIMPVVGAEACEDCGAGGGVVVGGRGGAEGAEDFGFESEDELRVRFDGHGGAG